MVATPANPAFASNSRCSASLQVGPVVVRLDGGDDVERAIREGQIGHRVRIPGDADQF